MAGWGTQRLVGSTPYSAAQQASVAGIGQTMAQQGYGVNADGGLGSMRTATPMGGAMAPGMGDAMAPTRTLSAAGTPSPTPTPAPAVPVAPLGAPPAPPLNPPPTPGQQQAASGIAQYLPGGAAQPQTIGASQPVAPSAPAYTPAPSALTAPTNQAGAMDAFRFQNASSPEMQNYNAIAAQYGPQAAGAYFNANRNALSPGITAQAGQQFTQNYVNTYGGGTNYGGAGHGYSGGGVSPDGKFFLTGMDPTKAAQMGLQKDAYSNMYKIPLQNAATSPIAGTPLGNAVARAAGNPIMGFGNEAVAQRRGY